MGEPRVNGWRGRGCDPAPTILRRRYLTKPASLVRSVGRIQFVQAPVGYDKQQDKEERHPITVGTNRYRCAHYLWLHFAKRKWFLVVFDLDDVEKLAPHTGSSKQSVTLVTGKPPMQDLLLFDHIYSFHWLPW